MSNVEPIDTFAAIEHFGIPARPSTDLNPALDAAERCLARHGVRRTTMTDIAREMGVSRPTLYKHLGSTEEAITLVVARQIYLILDELNLSLSKLATAQTFIDMAVRVVTFARTHPVAERVLVHEPELVGNLITTGQAVRYSDWVVDLVAPLLGVMMEGGAIRASDPHLTAELIVRLCGSLILAPTSGDTERLIGHVLGPVLEPGSSASGPSR